MEGSLVEAQSATLRKIPPKNLPLGFPPPPLALEGLAVVVVFDLEEAELLPLRLVDVLWMVMTLSSSRVVGKLLLLPVLDIF